MSWDNLKTIAKFDDVFKKSSIIDERNDLATNQCNATSPHQSGKFIIPTSSEPNLNEFNTIKPNTSTSLLIQSVIQLCCLLLEEDSEQSKESYRQICEQLSSLNLIDDSYLLSEFDETRGIYQMQIYKIICASRGQDHPIHLPNNCQAEKQSKNVETCWSRYRREFDEIEFIASGGFGKVYKARHKLDCIEYAVKQIKINSTTIKLCHLAEVKTIASLNHPNIVQYKAAWLEPYLPSNKQQLNSTKNSSLVSTSSWEMESVEESENMKTQTSENYDDINDIDNESSDFIQFEHSNSSNSIQIEKYSSNNEKKSYENIICKYSSEHVITNHRKSALLFIQMSLCQLTLSKWLTERNAYDSLDNFYLDYFGAKNKNAHLDVVHNIFTQILTGLDFIHSRNIIHHDIKPSNIFLSLEKNGKFCVQLGDFGLACPLQDHHSGFALGTPQYAAPEQLKGECDPKSDIYSLGIVLLEMLLCFKTDMERIKTIENARKGYFPLELSKKSIKLLKSLLGNVEERPSTAEILEVVRSINLEQELRKLKISNSQDDQLNEIKNENKLLKGREERNLMEINRLLIQLECKQNEIDKMKKDMNLKDKEILELKKSLYRCNFKDKKSI